MNLLYIYVCITYQILQTDSANILGVFAVGGKSHFILDNALMRGLAEAGHNVTVLSPYDDTRPVNNGTYRSIVLTGFAEKYAAVLKKRNYFKTNRFNQLFYYVGLHNSMLPAIKTSLEHHNFQKLLKSTSENFDVVVVEQFNSDVMKAVAWHFGAHLIVISPASASPGINSLVGNPLELPYNPIPYTNFNREMNFIQRVHNTVLHVIEELSNYFIFHPKHNQLIQTHFPGAPSLKDIANNVSLVLSNSHESVTISVPTVPNMVRIGGLHIQPPKELPQDLQDYLDSSENGVIYFSMGSHLRSSHMHIEKVNALLGAFKRLKQKVLWKWDEGDFPGESDNVRIEKWVPQVEVLAHPNVKLFITHGGLLSIFEAVYHEVPMLAIPVFYDQASNANNAVLDGYAISLPYQDINFSEEHIYSLIQELLTNPSYAENAKRRSRVYHDRTMSPMETAIYWVNYVIKHNGAPHLRITGLSLQWYKYLLLDVIIFLVVIFIIIFLASILLFRFFYRTFVSIKKIKTS